MTPEGFQAAINSIGQDKVHVRMVSGDLHTGDITMAEGVSYCIIRCAKSYSGNPPPDAEPYFVAVAIEHIESISQSY